MRGRLIALQPAAHRSSPLQSKTVAILDPELIRQNRFAPRWLFGEAQPPEGLPPSSVQQGCFHSVYSTTSFPRRSWHTLARHKTKPNAEFGSRSQFCRHKLFFWVQTYLLACAHSSRIWFIQSV